MAKLANWRRDAGQTQEEFAQAIGCSQSYISQIERAHDPLVPRKDIMVRIFKLTNGAVTPNDFYDLPELCDAAPVREPESLAA